MIVKVHFVNEKLGSKKPFQDLLEFFSSRDSVSFIDGFEYNSCILDSKGSCPLCRESDYVEPGKCIALQKLDKYAEKSLHYLYDLKDSIYFDTYKLKQEDIDSLLNSI